MKEEQLLALIEKYLDGTATEEEKQLLDHWYRKQNEQETVWHADSAQEEQVLEQRMLLHIYQHIKADDTCCRYFYLCRLFTVDKKTGCKSWSAFGGCRTCIRFRKSICNAAR
jgi:hypothetical protein